MAEKDSPAIGILGSGAIDVKPDAAPEVGDRDQPSRIALSPAARLTMANTKEAFALDLNEVLHSQVHEFAEADSGVGQDPDDELVTLAPRPALQAGDLLPAQPVSRLLRHPDTRRRGRHLFTFSQGPAEEVTDRPHVSAYRSLGERRSRVEVGPGQQIRLETLHEPRGEVRRLGELVGGAERQEDAGQRPVVPVDGAMRNLFRFQVRQVIVDKGRQGRRLLLALPNDRDLRHLLTSWWTSGRKRAGLYQRMTLFVFHIE